MTWSQRDAIRRAPATSLSQPSSWVSSASSSASCYDLFSSASSKMCTARPSPNSLSFSPKGSFTRCIFVNATAIKIGCVGVNETVHMVWLWCICLCDVTHGMGSIPILCDCDARFQYVSAQIAVTPCEQTALNCRKKLSKNAVGKEINRTVWTSLEGRTCFCLGKWNFHLVETSTHEVIHPGQS